jgi:integrase/recombinase XerD
LTREAATGIIKRILARAGIKRVKGEKSVRYDIPIDMGFRKRFNSILKSNPNISYAIAERLMDHRTNLESHYLDTPVDKLFEEYKKAIPELIIDDSERLKARNRTLEIEKSDLEKKNLEIENLKLEQQKIIEDLKKVKARQERAEKHQKKRSEN